MSRGNARGCRCLYDPCRCDDSREKQDADFEADLREIEARYSAQRKVQLVENLLANAIKASDEIWDAHMEAFEQKVYAELATQLADNSEGLAEDK